MIIYMELADHSLAPYIDGEFKIVTHYTITVFGTDIKNNKVDPDRFSEYEINHIIAVLGQMGWFCTPQKGDFYAYFWCYKHTNDQQGYDQAIADMRLMVTPLNDTETNKAIRKMMREGRE